MTCSSHQSQSAEVQRRFLFLQRSRIQDCQQSLAFLLTTQHPHANTIELINARTETKDNNGGSKDGLCGMSRLFHRCFGHGVVKLFLCSFLFPSFIIVSFSTTSAFTTHANYLRSLHHALLFFLLPDSTHSRLHVMPGSHIHNTYAPSTPTNPFVAAPRPPKGIGFTGNISTAYDTGVVSDADGPIIAKLHSNTTQPVRCAGSIAVQVASAVEQNVKSFEGQVDVHANHQNGAYGRKPVILPTSGVQNDQSYGSSHYIPKNSISPANDLRLTSKPQKPRRSGINPQADYPQPVSIQSHSQPIRGHYSSIPNIPPAITTGLFPLPPILSPAPASPISPLLAAPPQAHYFPLPSPSSSHPSPHRHTPSSSPSTPRHILPPRPCLLYIRIHKRVRSFSGEKSVL